jgi:NhaP-type Na+/H+ or K+/H+ antiporter
MVWSHLVLETTNLTFLFFGAFTSLFMLYSAFFKQVCYLGEANIAFITGIVFGPLAANVLSPIGWGNTAVVDGPGLAWANQKSLSSP